MSKRIEGNQTENSGRNVQGSLDFSEINAYFEQEEDAPSAQEVFDHYWSVLEYVLSDDEKREILTAAPEEGIKKLLALGGGVWNVFEGKRTVLWKRLWECGNLLFLNVLLIFFEQV